MTVTGMSSGGSGVTMEWRNGSDSSWWGMKTIWRWNRHWARISELLLGARHPGSKSSPLPFYFLLISCFVFDY